MIEGDEMYAKVRRHATRSFNENGYLEVRDFDVIKNDFQMYNNDFSISYAPESPFFGSLKDSINENSIGKTLRASLEQLFESHSAGILIAESLSL